MDQKLYFFDINLPQVAYIPTQKKVFCTYPYLAFKHTKNMTLIHTQVCEDRVYKYSRFCNQVYGSIWFHTFNLYMSKNICKEVETPKHYSIKNMKTLLDASIQNSNKTYFTNQFIFKNGGFKILSCSIDLRQFSQFAHESYIILNEHQILDIKIDLLDKDKYMSFEAYRLYTSCYQEFKEKNSSVAFPIECPSEEDISTHLFVLQIMNGKPMWEKLCPIHVTAQEFETIYQKWLDHDTIEEEHILDLPSDDELQDVRRQLHF